jgi:hypothetical protein
VIWGGRKAKYFFVKGWTNQSNSDYQNRFAHCVDTPTVAPANAGTITAGFR